MTLIIDKDAALALNPDTTAHTYIGFRPDGSWKRLCMIYNKHFTDMMKATTKVFGPFTRRT